MMAAIAASVAVVAAGCGSDASPGSAPTVSSAPAETAPSASPVAPGGPADASQATIPAVLKFNAETANGQAFDGSTLAGKPVVLWFWAPWCAVCRSQVPEIEKLVADYGDDLKVVGVGSLDSGSAIRGFAQDVPGPLQLSDPQGELWKRFKIVEQSSFVVLDASGTEVLRTGYNDDDALADAVRKVVG